MNRVIEELFSRNAAGDPISGPLMTFSNPMVCFTEVRLTQSREHTSKYGLLGLGFSREFLIARDGLPVIYLRNGQRDLFTSVLHQIWQYLPKDKQPGLGFNVFGGLCKGMSNSDTDDFEYLHESEWRIVHNDYLTATGLAEMLNRGEHPESYVRFTPEDLKLVIAPDEQTRNMFYESPVFRKWTDSSRTKPVVLSYEKLFEY